MYINHKHKNNNNNNHQKYQYIVYVYIYIDFIQKYIYIYVTYILNNCGLGRACADPELDPQPTADAGTYRRT